METNFEKAKKIISDACIIKLFEGKWRTMADLDSIENALLIASTPNTIPEIDLETAEKLALQTDYYQCANTDLVPINVGDAAVFFLEGYNYAMELILKSQK